MNRPRITLGIPVKDAHEYTAVCVGKLDKTSAGALDVVVVDNGSRTPWRPQRVTDFVRLDRNIGYYATLPLVCHVAPAEFVGLMHNDVEILEAGWDARVLEAFDADPRLGLIGFCGSHKIDAAGGRGDGTVCNFRGVRGQPQPGRRITDLSPALVLDSLFMLFRREAIRDLGLTGDLPLAHFVDKAWPIRLVQAGWHVAVLGIEIEHHGGVTAADVEAFEADARRWCEARDVPIAHGEHGAHWGLALYLEAERRFMAEYAPVMPSWVDRRYEWHPGDGPAEP